MMNIPHAFLMAIFEVAYDLLSLYVWVIIIGAIMSWLVAFGVINTHNNFVRGANDFIYRVTEPLLKPIRRALPPMGGFDLSPLVLILIIMFLQRFIMHLVF